MKKFYLYLVLLIGVVSHAQSPAELNSLTEVQARSFADKIATSGQTKWELVSAKENSRGTYYTVKYVNAAASAEIKQEAEEGVSCDDCLKVTYSITPDKHLKFYEVFGKYNDLFPTWKKVFRSDADVTKTVEDLDSQEVVNGPANINFKFKKMGSLWRINNFN